MKDTLHVTITTAVPLTSAQRKTIESGISKKYPNQSVTVSEEIDPQLIGGVRLRVGSIEHDHSVAGKLEQLRNVLTKTD